MPHISIEGGLIADLMGSFQPRPEQTIINHYSDTLPFNSSLRCASNYASDFYSEMANVVDSPQGLSMHCCFQESLQTALPRASFAGRHAHLTGQFDRLKPH